MTNKREIYKDDITKLIDGKSLDEIIENLIELRLTNYGCEKIKLKLTTNYRPMVAMYDVVTEIPSNVDLNRNPEVLETTDVKINHIKKLVSGKMNDNTGKTLPCKVEITKESSVEKYETIDIPFPMFSYTNLPLNFFIDTSYYKEVFNKDVDAQEEVDIINNLKVYYKNTRNRVFVKYGEGDNDCVAGGYIAGFTIINLDSIVSDKIDISVFNPYYTRYLIGKQGIKARELAAEINKELGYERVKKIFFKEIK